MKTQLSLLLASVVLVGCASERSTDKVTKTDTDTATNIEVLPVSEIKRQQLTPARGDQSPQAGTL